MKCGISKSLGQSTVAPPRSKRTPDCRSRVGQRTVGTLDLDALNQALAERGIHLEDSVRDDIGFLPKDAARNAIDRFGQLVAAGLQSWRVPALLQDPLEVALGWRRMSGRLLLSNALIRERASTAMIDQLGTYWKATHKTPGRTWWFVTVVGDEGNALEYEPVVDLPAFRRTFADIMEDSGLAAVCSIEVQAITNFPQRGYGRAFMFHGHAIGWTDEKDFAPADVELALNQSGKLTHWLGARTVVIKPIPNSYRHITWRAYYALKAPCEGKYLIRNQATPSGFGFKQTDVRKDLAVRLVECLSQLEYPDTVFGIGDGSQVRAAWLTELSDWHTGVMRRAPDIMSDYDLKALWQLLWRRRSVKARKPFDFDGKSARVPSLWEVAVSEWEDSAVATRRWSHQGRAG